MQLQYYLRKIAELGIYPAVDPLDSTSRILTPEILGKEHYGCAQRVKELLQRYKELQDIIAILGMEELSEEDKLAVSLRTSCTTFLITTVPRSRAVYRYSGSISRHQRHNQRIQYDHEW